jgi:hypothetical protein
MKLHCFLCATITFPDDPVAEQKHHSYYLHAQVDAFQRTGVQLTLIQNGCEFPSLGIPVIRTPIAKNVAYNWLLCDTNCAGDYWIFLPEDCRVTPAGWEAIRKRDGRACFTLAKDPKALICRKGIFEELPGEVRTACDLNFMGKELGCLLVRGELEKHGFHSISPHWTQVSKAPPLWANEYFEMIPGEHPNTNLLRRMPSLDNYGVREYKATPSKIEELYTKIVRENVELLARDAISCKSLISKYGPITTEVPHDSSHT